MAGSRATRSSRGHRTICLPIPEETYQQIIDDPRAFRRTIDDCFRRMPELFPRNFPGYQLKDHRVSAKQGVTIRRVLLKDGTTYSIRPSFLMPYMTARTADVEGPLFLRKFGVPFWALAHVFGRDPMSWYRLECGLGRFSVVGTTVRQAELPAHLLADEHHQIARRPEGLHRHDRRRRMLPGGGAGRDGGDRRPEGRLRGLQGGGPRHHPRVRPQDRQHRRLEGDASGLEGAVPEGGHPAVLLARVAQDPGPGQALEGAVRGGLPAGLGGVPRARPPQLRATAPLAAAVGDRTPHGDRPGEGPGPVRQARRGGRSRTSIPTATARATCSTA